MMPNHVRIDYDVYMNRNRYDVCIETLVYSAEYMPVGCDNSQFHYYRSKIGRVYMCCQKHKQSRPHLVQYGDVEISEEEFICTQVTEE